jgi:hypothetical protein
MGRLLPFSVASRPHTSMLQYNLNVRFSDVSAAPPRHSATDLYLDRKYVLQPSRLRLGLHAHAVSEREPFVLHWGSILDRPPAPSDQ